MYSEPTPFRVYCNNECLFFRNLLLTSVSPDQAFNLFFSDAHRPADPDDTELTAPDQSSYGSHRNTKDRRHFADGQQWIGDLKPCVVRVRYGCGRALPRYTTVPRLIRPIGVAVLLSPDRQVACRIR